MKNKIITLFLITLLIAGFSSVSPARNISKKDFSENFKIQIFPNQNDDSEVEAGDTIVVITSPENGAELDEPYLEVLGYAIDSDGLYFMEWTYEYGVYHHYENATLEGAYSYGFRIRVFDLNPGTHTVTVTYYDYYNNSGSDSVTVYYGENQAPEKPNRPTGPEDGSIGISYQYSTHASDPDADDIRYGWDWDGDDVVDEWTGYYSSGEVVNVTHIWANPGIYNVKVKADDGKEKSIFSTPLTVHIIENSAPSKPETPIGQGTGKPGISYSYSTYSYDPEDHYLYYMFDWGDGTTPEWKGPFASGDIVNESHIWDTKGTFQVKVKARDDPNGDGDLSDGLESVWSSTKPVQMPKKPFSIVNWFFTWLIQQFPLIDSIVHM